MLGWQDYSFEQCADLMSELTPAQIARQRDLISRTYPAMSDKELDWKHNSFLHPVMRF